MAELERAIEADCVELAEQCGWDTYKLDKKRNWPDQMFLGPEQEIFFVEFKRPGEKARVGQQRRIDRLIALGHLAYLIDSRAAFLLLFAQRIRSADLPRYYVARAALEQRMAKRVARLHTSAP